MSSASFCTNCGTPLAPGARFCPSCGQGVAAPPAAPPAYPQVAPPSYPPAYSPPAAPLYPQAAPPAYPPPQPYPPAYPPPYVQPRPRRPSLWGMFLGRGWWSVLGLVIGALLLLLLLARCTALQIAGQITTGTVTAVTLNDTQGHEYRIEYSFAAPDGSAVSGAMLMGDVLDQSKLPRVGDQVRVRFLPFWPAINDIPK